MYTEFRVVALFALVAVVCSAGCGQSNNTEQTSIEISDTDIANASPVEQSSKSKLGKRRLTLDEAGPMIPPVPAVLLSVNGAKEGEDEISVVWTFVLNGKPPQVGVSVDDSHVALGFLKQHKQFVLNVPTADMVKQFDTVDMNSSKVGDKFKLSGLTRGKAQGIDAPTVEESPIQLECRVTNVIRVPPKRTVFIADVVSTRVLEGAVDKSGKLDVNKVPFFGMTAGSGEFFTMGKRIGNIGQTIGRDDIKY